MILSYCESVIINSFTNAHWFNMSSECKHNHGVLLTLTYWVIFLSVLKQGGSMRLTLLIWVLYCVAWCCMWCIPPNTHTCLGIQCPTLVTVWVSLSGTESQCACASLCRAQRAHATVLANKGIWELIKLLHCAGYLCDITHHACVFGWMQSRFKFSPLHLSCSLCFSCTCFCGELLLIISSSSFPPCILGFSSHFSSSSLAPYPSPTFLPSTSLPPIHLIYPLLFFPWTTWPGSLP